MKSILENIAAHLSVPSPSHVLVQLWGTSAQAEDLKQFVKILEPIHTSVTGILFDSEAMVQACEKGPYDIGHHISEDEITQMFLKDFPAQPKQTLKQFVLRDALT